MFSSISWQEFLNAICIVLGAYYGISILLLYSREIIQRFNTKGDQTDNPVRKVKEDSVNLMGGIKKDLPKKHEQTVDAQELIVEQPNSNDQYPDNEDSLLIGSVSDLLHEIKVLARVIKESSGSKEEGAPMFQSLLSNYAHLSATKYQQSVSLFIHDLCGSECGFEVDLSEVNAWWPISESENNQ
jgi:hypothetical protein